MGQPGLLFSEDLHWALPPGFQFILTAPQGVGVSFPSLGNPNHRDSFICSCGHF